MPIIPPRAILPEGMSNYVTANGLEELLEERKEMEAQKSQLQQSEEDNRVPIRVLDIKLSNITERIDTAEVIDPTQSTPVEVRFGLHVSYRIGDSGDIHTFRIVGVDEADVKKKKIAFTAPIMYTRNEGQGRDVQWAWSHSRWHYLFARRQCLGLCIKWTWSQSHEHRNEHLTYSPSPEE